MELILEIQDLARSGAGVGRDGNGRVVFVPFTAPGDKVRAQLTMEDKRYAEARVVEFLERSPARDEAPCPVFGKCGGCEWQHLPYEKQWEAKKGGVLHALKRVEMSTDGVSFREFPAERIWEYRNRVQLRGLGDQIGFYARGSNSLVPVDKCFIARPELNSRIGAAREAGRTRPREYKVELEVHENGEITETWNAGHSARGFRQVHDEQNKKLQDWVRENAGEGGVLLDLYGGAGNLSLGIADRFQEVHCVDIGSPLNRPEGTPTNFRFHRFEVLEWLKRSQDKFKGSKVHAVLDPPREGLGTDLAPIIEILKALPAISILLIGCEPDPWARAAARFQKKGWKLSELGALDFFPQTHHVEALAKFRLGD